MLNNMPQLKDNPITGSGAWRDAALLMSDVRVVVPGFYLFIVARPFREESLWSDSRLMTRRKVAVAAFPRLKNCNTKTETEPKRNIIRVAENDFSSKMLQVGYRQTLHRSTLQGECQIER